MRSIEGCPRQHLNCDVVNPSMSAVLQILSADYKSLRQLLLLQLVAIERPTVQVLLYITAEQLTGCVKLLKLWRKSSLR